jgi:hypothetical protein
VSTDRAQRDSAFLPSIAGILSRLQRTSEELGHPMLAYLIDMARAEAEEQMRCDLQDATFRAEVLATSSVHSWRDGAAIPQLAELDLSEFDFFDLSQSKAA